LFFWSLKRVGDLPMEVLTGIVEDGKGLLDDDLTKRGMWFMTKTPL